MGTKSLIMKSVDLLTRECHLCSVTTNETHIVIAHDDSDDLFSGNVVFTGDATCCSLVSKAVSTIDKPNEIDASQLLIRTVELLKRDDLEHLCLQVCSADNYHELRNSISDIDDSELRAYVLNSLRHPTFSLEEGSSEYL